MQSQIHSLSYANDPVHVYMQAVAPTLAELATADVITSESGLFIATFRWLLEACWECRRRRVSTFS